MIVRVYPLAYHKSTIQCYKHIPMSVSCILSPKQKERSSVPFSGTLRRHRR